MISRFRIKNLFGYQTVNIPFSDPVKILIGENGLGKTTVLNCLYFLLREKFDKLSQIEFEEIEIEFTFEKKRTSVLLRKADVNSYKEQSQRGLTRSKKIWFDNIRAAVDLSDLRSIVKVNQQESLPVIEYVRKSLRDAKLPLPPSGVIIEFVFHLLEFEEIDQRVAALRELIKAMDVEIFYFPTYRRVEEDIRNLETVRKHRYEGLMDEEDFYEAIEEHLIDDNTIVHFGMQDVEDRIESVKQEIKDSSIKGFSRVTGEMLTQLLQGAFPNAHEGIAGLNQNIVHIILRRVGDSLSAGDRKEIQNLIKDPEKLAEKKELVFFLNKLMGIHTQHKHIDDSIKKFKNVCNHYLRGKEFRYDESAVDLRIFRKTANPEDKVHVPLHKLSSGEKQIVSLFSKIYLGKSPNLLILFDEPELSLSIEWQKRLLPDINSSGKAKFLLTVTHSPFIFNNNLSEKAVAMGAYTSVDGINLNDEFLIGSVE